MKVFLDSIEIERVREFNFLLKVILLPLYPLINSLILKKFTFLSEIFKKYQIF